MLNHGDAAIAGRDGRTAPHADARVGRDGKRISLRRSLAALAGAPLRLHRYRALRVRSVEAVLRRSDDCSND